eukprot:11998914-Prorocentrum_lima.AAC.1
MTSSLVGSEMCIRDSKSTHNLGLCAHCRSVTAALLTRSRAGRTRSSFGPVSYTHLTLPTICSV